MKVITPRLLLRRAAPRENIWNDAEGAPIEFERGSQERAKVCEVCLFTRYSVKYLWSEHFLSGQNIFFRVGGLGGALGIVQAYEAIICKRPTSWMHL